jgi:hypothetical protein
MVKVAKSGETDRLPIPGVSLGLQRRLASQGDARDFAPTPQSHARSPRARTTTDDNGHPVHLIYA